MARRAGGGAARVVASLLLAAACGEEEVVVPRHRPSTAPVGPVVEPQVVATTADGDKLFFGRGACSACHKVGERGGMIVGPNLGVGDGMDAPLAVRAAMRRPELAPIEYVIESMLDPDGLVVPTYAPAVMKPVDELPSQLSDEELVALAAFVASQGAAAPLTTADLERARQQIAPARARRAARRGASAAPAAAATTSASADAATP